MLSLFSSKSVGEKEKEPPKGPPFTFLALCDLPETSKKIRKEIRKFFLKIEFFSNFFPHAGTVEENT